MAMRLLSGYMQSLNQTLNRSINQLIILVFIQFSFLNTNLKSVKIVVQLVQQMNLGREF